MIDASGKRVPISNLVNPLLTDFYQITMAYGYWLSGMHEKQAVFDLHFRKAPFNGAFTIFAGIEEVVRFLCDYHFEDEQIAYIRAQMPGAKEGFFDWLKNLDLSQVRIYSLTEGTLAFPHVPLLTVEGPLAICQLLETTLLNLVNYPTLIATNAARFRLAAGADKRLLEFGLRRAQGPDGGLSASRYSYIGGFDATSNVLAGQMFGIPVAGTHAHSWVQSFLTLDEVQGFQLVDKQGVPHDFTRLVQECRQELGFVYTNDDELAAFIGYAIAFPDGFLALVDTYDTLKSGIPNFIAVATALIRLGYKPLGIRLDSGDLAFLSKAARAEFRRVQETFGIDLSGIKIVASNDVNEETLLALNQQGHAIDTFGIGTNLVTCQAQPALGGVYKLVEVDGQPRIKLSQELGKVTIPGRKKSYRLIGSDGSPLLDLMTQANEEPPEPGKRILCLHPFVETKRAYVTPAKVVPLHVPVWDGGPTELAFRPMKETREYVLRQLASLRPDHLRPLNPTPYKVSVTERLFQFLHEIWLSEAPIAEIR